MQLIKPATIDDAVLTDSNVALETAWNSGTTYAEGAVVRVGDTLYRSTGSGNVGNDPTAEGTTHWSEDGPANRWAMFDTAVGTQTINADSVEVTLEPTGFVDSFALLNLSGATVQVTLQIGEDDPYFDETYSLIDNSAVIDWWTWLFEPIKQQTDLAVTGLAPFYGPTINVSVNAPSADAKVGTLVIGQAKYIGRTQYGARLGIDDFSRKETDDFGVSTLLRRTFRRRGDYSVTITNDALDGIYTLLSDLRATPLIWIPTDSFGATLLYGWYREFATEITYPTESLVTLSLEGLS